MPHQHDQTISCGPIKDIPSQESSRAVKVRTESSHESNRTEPSHEPFYPVEQISSPAEAEPLNVWLNKKQYFWAF